MGDAGEGAYPLLDTLQGLQVDPRRPIRLATRQSTPPIQCSQKYTGRASQSVKMGVEEGSSKESPGDSGGSGRVLGMLQHQLVHLQLNRDGIVAGEAGVAEPST